MLQVSWAGSQVWRALTVPLCVYSVRSRGPWGSRPHYLERPEEEMASQKDWAGWASNFLLTLEPQREKYSCCESRRNDSEFARVLCVLIEPGSAIQWLLFWGPAGGPWPLLRQRKYGCPTQASESCLTRALGYMHSTLWEQMFLELSTETRGDQGLPRNTQLLW